MASKRKRTNNVTIYNPRPVNPTALVAYCELWSVNSELEPKHPSSDYELVGPNIANGTLLKDEKGQVGCYFVFPQLSVRYPGHFCLRFTICDISK